VNLRPSAPPVPLLFALLVLVAASARFGAQTLAELSGATQAQLWGVGAMWTALAGCGSWLLLMLVIAYVNLARPLPLPAAPVPAEPVTMATEVERVVYHPDDNEHEGWFLDASPQQWRAVYLLTQTRDGIVFNVIDGEGRAFASHADLDNFRQMLVRAGLAYARGDQVLLNVRGRQMVARYGSPAPPGKGKK
jgi:hypothetical protein